MTFLPVIPSQAIASRYLSSLASVYALRLRVGGHSKGGNLAIYAAATLSAEQRRRIVAVYNNDGPGFSGSFLDSDGYRAIRDRVRIIVPDTSIIGMLLEHAGVYTVVRSSKSGFRQHDGFSWAVMGDKFIHLDAISKNSRVLDENIEKMLSEMSREDRRRFVKNVFAAIETQTGAKTLTELSNDKMKLFKVWSALDDKAKAQFREFAILFISKKKK